MDARRQRATHRTCHASKEPTSRFQTPFGGFRGAGLSQARISISAQQKFVPARGQARVWAVVRRTRAAGRHTHVPLARMDAAPADPFIPRFIRTMHLASHDPNRDVDAQIASFSDAPASSGISPNASSALGSEGRKKNARPSSSTVAPAYKVHALIRSTYRPPRKRMRQTLVPL